MTRFLQSIIALTVLFMVSGAWGSLVLTPNGLGVYDTVLDITWAQDANINGLDTWDNQVAWAAGLKLGGESDWRLANMDLDGNTGVVNCSLAAEIFCRDNEYGYLFHQYDISSATPGLFRDVGTNYWSSTSAIPSTFAWFFNMDAGTQPNPADKTSPNLLGWAVADGNVFNAEVAAVPLPAAVWLLGSALGLLGWMRRKAS